MRLAGSSGANPFACIAAGVSSLWGPAHGGANQAALEMLEEIGSTKNIKKYLNKAKSKKDPFKLMGFGHRVYKNYDPRAKILKKICKKFSEKDKSFFGETKAWPIEYLYAIAPIVDDLATILLVASCL